MMATGSESASAVGATSADVESAGLGSGENIWSNVTIGGTSGQFGAMASRNDSSPQQMSEGEQSFITPTSSAAAWRAYNGTTMMPSARIARSVATQRMVLFAISAQRSPLFRFDLRRNVRTALIWAS